MTPTEFELFKTLPARFFQSYGKVNATRPTEGKSNVFIPLHFGDVPVPNHVHDRTVIVEDEALWAEIEAHVASNKELAEEKENFEKQTRGVIETFNTSDKLLEAWPTVGILLGPDYFKEPVKASVPATTINTLDEALKAVRPFETETQAA